MSQVVDMILHDQPSLISESHDAKRCAPNIMYSIIPDIVVYWNTIFIIK